MGNENAETGRNPEVAATPDKQMVEEKPTDVPAPATTPTERPWTSDFVLPSISFREPKDP